jgi:NADPH:quinone reductase-like Zn-dependent oxidoreductase
MRAVRIHADGLRLDEIERPVARADEALVRVHAAAITRGELEWPEKRLPAVPSYELSGEIAETGDEVFALLPFDRDGAAADFVAVPAALLVPKPRRLTHVEAAALPMTALTAWQALIEHGELQAGERVLITGASGGVGHMAVQLARYLGADVVTEEPADLVFDTTGGELPRGRRAVTIAEPTSGATYFIVEPNAGQLSRISTLADAGELVPQIDSTYPLERAAEAFDRVEARDKHGKVVLDVAD